MGKDTKSARRQEKKAAQAAKEDSDSDDDADEEEEEEVESAAVRQKKARGRSAFLKLLNRCLAVIPLMLVLTRQPFVVRPRGSGVNAAKIKPLELAISGAVHWAAESPMVMKNPKIYTYVNATGRALLTPGQYVEAQQSKRAMPNEKTWAGAYKKTEKAFTRLVDKDTALKEMVSAPMPNVPLLGSYAAVLGSVFCPLLGGPFMYMIAGGCLVILHAGRQSGMEAQPELYVTIAVAVVMVMVAETAGKVPPAPKKKRR